MTVYLRDPDFVLHLGDVREVLPTLESESVDCVATSPPFFGLRDYGTGSWDGGDPACDHSINRRDIGVEVGLKNEAYANPQFRSARYAHNEIVGRDCKCGARRIDRQIGLEATPDEWAAELVAVFRECRRVLRPHGTLWIECGDSYGTGSGPTSDKSTLRGNGHIGGGPKVKARPDVQILRGDCAKGYEQAPARSPLKPKDLLGTPWLLAFALRADGWYLRQAIIWHKPNAMPESVTDRCTTAHSYVFLLSKSPRYWFDADAIAEPAAWERWGDQTVPKHNGTQTSAGWIAPKTKNEIHEFVRSRETREAAGVKAFSSGTPNYTRLEGAKNPRSVWTIPTRGYPGAHFATWPETLAERIVKAGCPEWVCGTCGKPRERITDRTAMVIRRSERTHEKGRTRSSGTMLEPPTRETIGWSDCGHDNYRPGVILDPFMGSGTTALVARRLGRHAVGVELNESYAAMCAERTHQLSVFAEETL